MSPCSAETRLPGTGEEQSVGKNYTVVKEEDLEFDVLVPFLSERQGCHLKMLTLLLLLLGLGMALSRGKFGVNMHAEE